MEYLEMVNEIAKYKTRAEYYMRVLEDVKASIQIAMDNDENMKNHFAFIAVALIRPQLLFRTNMQGYLKPIRSSVCIQSVPTPKLLPQASQRWSQLA